VHIFTEINANYIVCGGLFQRIVTTVTSVDKIRFVEAVNFYVVSFMTERDQRHERDKLRT